MSKAESHLNSNFYQSLWVISSVTFYVPSSRKILTPTNRDRPWESLLNCWFGDMKHLKLSYHVRVVTCDTYLLSIGWNGARTCQFDTASYTAVIVWWETVLSTPNNVTRSELWIWSWFDLDFGGISAFGNVFRFYKQTITKLNEYPRG